MGKIKAEFGTVGGGTSWDDIITNMTELIPTMTSNNTPSGECICYTPGSTTNKAATGTHALFYGFNNSSVTNPFMEQTGVALNDVIGYKFDNPVTAYILKFYSCPAQTGFGLGSYKVVCSDDGLTWTEMTNTLTSETTNVEDTIYLVNTRKCKYYGVQAKDRTGTIQFINFQLLGLT